MQVVADRFVVKDEGAIDLATGRRVHLVLSTVAGVTEQAQWAERCALFLRLRHPVFAPLVDYGVFAESRRFEAWAVEDEWRGTRSVATIARDGARTFLDAIGRTWSGDAFVAARAERAVVVPGAHDGTQITGRPQVSAASTGASGPSLRRGENAINGIGILEPDDPRLHALSEMFACEQRQRPVAAAICVPAEGTAEHPVHLLARAARLAGFVPVGTEHLSDEVRRQLSLRSIVFIVTDAPDHGWRRLLAASLARATSHMAVFVGQRAVRRVYTTGPRLWTEDELVNAVVPREWTAQQLRRVRTAARRSMGNCSRFERLLFGEPHYSAPMSSSQRDESTSTAEPRVWLPRRARLRNTVLQPGASRSQQGARLAPAEAGDDLGHVRAAEHAVAYGADRLPDGRGSHGIVGADWPTPGEMTRLKHQLHLGRAALRRGRHTTGERLLRQAAHALARRGAWVPASDAAITLARALRDRGRTADVVEMIDVARPWAVNAEDVGLLTTLAVVKAGALFEQGRFADAESLCEIALSAALSSGTGVSRAALALARCLFWQGRFTDAWHRLSLLHAETEDKPGDDVRLLIARSRVAIGRADVASSVAAAARARDLASTLCDVGLVARAWLACALAQLAAGDDSQADASARAGLVASRRAHLPLVSWQARLLKAEVARRRGQRGPALLLLRRTEPQAKLLPLTIRASMTVLRALVDGRGDLTDVERCVESTGLGGLRVYARVRSESGAGSSLGADDIAELLRCCQAAQEDVAVLVAVCARIRERLKAAGVGFFGCDQNELVCIASDGARAEIATARRVQTINALVVPRHGDERIEGGVPVRYAGQLVGVLAVKWTGPVSMPDADVSMLLTTGAVAAGPALGGALARRAAARMSRAADVLGVSPAMGAVRSALERAAAAPFPVLIVGESGAGKELAARMLHKLGPRRDRPFCAINCAALPDDLLETELFGHARGAFTGAAVERRGVFEEAHSGTLFLDEVGELSPRAQAKLLRAIQEGEIRRVGENVSRRVDVRLVTATNRDLRQEAAAERFRLDLLYRLDVIRIALPPLRDRPEDIPVLVEHFWRDATERIGSRATLSASTVAALTRYLWPGNIRELQNVLAALAVRAPKRGVIAPSALPAQCAACEPGTDFRLESARQVFDRSFIRAALVRSGGQRSRAARELGLSRQGLAKLMTKLGLGDDSVAESI